MTAPIALRRRVEQYLAVRRAVGYKLVENEHLLRQFIAYLEQTGAATITTEAAVAWATQPIGAKPTWWRRRLSVVRGLARHLHALDPTCQVPRPECCAAFRTGRCRTCIPMTRSAP